MSQKQNQITKKLSQLPEDVKSVYLIDPSGVITLFNQRMEDILIGWLIKVLKIEAELFYDIDMIETEYEKKRIEHLIMDCAYTLINFIIHNVCKNLVNTNVLQCIGITCLYAASSVIVAHDLQLPQRPLLKFLASNSPDCTKEKIFEIFRDILKRTNGELCSANIHIERRYDEEEGDEKYNLSEMVIQGREMIEHALYNQEKRTFLLEYEDDQFILIDLDNTNVYTPDNPPSGVLKAKFFVTRSLVNIIARKKNKLMDETFIWLRDRVLKVGYKIEPLSFEYFDQSFYKMRAKSSQKSRRSSKTSQKSHKTSRRSTRSSQKSRKSTRKSTRKSNKSPRKSRKSTKTSRKSRK